MATAFNLLAMRSINSLDEVSQYLDLWISTMKVLAIFDSESRAVMAAENWSDGKLFSMATTDLSAGTS